MSKKKSYMNQSNLINEGFFSQIKRFMKNRPKIKGKKKLSILKGLKLALAVSGLNRAIDDFEAYSRKLRPDDEINMPRFKPEDFGQEGESFSIGKLVVVLSFSITQW